MTAESELVTRLTVVMGSQRQALAVAGVARSTWHYRHHRRATVTNPVAQRDRAYRSRIGAADRSIIERHIDAAWGAGASVDKAFADAWDDGLMLASRRSWWRIAAQMPDQSTRPVVPTRRAHANRQPRSAPVLTATGPQQVWSWDITDLRTPWRGMAFKAYSILDIYSRKIVGYRVEEREVDELAKEMFTAAIEAHGAPSFVHADSGAAMRSGILGDLFNDLGITRTHSRPRVSNDNPFSESEFRTMKYRPNFPGTFTTLDDARAYLDWYVPWYNSQHKHSGIALFSPDQVHDGTWKGTWKQREITLQAYYETHPERFRHRPHTPAPASTVGINQPTTQQPAA